MKKLIIFSCAVLLMAAKKDDIHKGFDVKTFEKSMVYIPMGSYMFMDSTAETQKGKMVSLSAFYMYKHEVSNNDYHIFLDDIKANDPMLYKRMLPDTTVWRSKQAYNEPYVKYYFSHPAYGDYPLVGVSYEQATYYCKWLTQKYMSDPKRKYKKVNFYIPNVYQWEYAAIGGQALSPFPWRGYYMTNYKGQYMANFLRVGQGMIKKEQFYKKDSTGKYVTCTLEVVDYGKGILPEGGDDNTADITSPVISYYPNDYGLYNMAGNVKEYVMEEGITKGGGWKDTGYYLQNSVEQTYDSTQKASNDRGFRFVMHVEEEPVKH